MDKAETFTLEMFIRVHGFGTARAAVFPATSRGGELFLSLDTHISTLQEHAATQFTSTHALKEGTERKAAALRELQEDLEAISRASRVMTLTPGLSEKFRLPKSASAQGWLAAARSILEEAEPVKAQFIRLGLPATFLEELEARITTLDDAIHHKGQVAGESVAASAAIDAAIESGMKIVRELDVIVRNVFRDDPATLAEWTSARHIERAHKRSTQQPPATPPTT